MQAKLIIKNKNKKNESLAFCFSVVHGTLPRKQDQESEQQENGIVKCLGRKVKGGPTFLTGPG